MRRLLLAIAALCCIAAAADPSEQLPDSAQEARARALFAEFRCVVCQNESIDDSEAEVAGLLRRTVREQVAAGRTDAEVRGYLVDRYGEFVLLKPTFSAGNAILWLLPLALLAGAGGLILWRARRTGGQTDEPPLSAEEEARLATLTADEDGRHRFASTKPSGAGEDDRRMS